MSSPTLSTLWLPEIESPTRLSDNVDRCPPNQSVCVAIVVAVKNVPAQTAERLARSAPGLPLGRVADAAGVCAKRLYDALRRPNTRSSCDADLVHAHSLSRSASRERLLTRPQCPPPLRRAATADRHEGERVAAPGVAGWATRPPLDAVAPPRSSYARVCVEQDPDIAWDIMLAADTATCPTAILTRLADSSDPAIRNAAANNPANSTAALAALAVTGSTTTLYLTSSNASTPGIVVDAASVDLTSDALAEFIDEAANLPPSALERFANEESSRVRSAVAEHAHCLTPLLERLAQDQDPTVRIRVVDNPEAPTEVLEMLASDASSLVSGAACERLGWF